MNHLTYIPYSEDDIDYVNTEMKSSYEPPSYRDLQKYQQLAHAGVERINVEKYFRQSIRNIDNSTASGVNLSYQMKEDKVKIPDYALYSDPTLYKELRSLKVFSI
ncbi:hypothetical protein PIROE2DRAFT_18392 [Piromyces sp. E2]|nr:hypothetical protein PIROE2DRAFT_18392 [Piromyces sp. E2]|eukprot:OUM56832.1 hypothetical protein PIROE2DRAFT_18392 [Piromyces sp. E2]